MSIEAKQMLIHEFEKRIGDILTINSSNDVLTILSELLSTYTIEYDENNRVDVEGSELLDAFMSAKRIEGRSEKTLARYKYVIECMMEKISVPIRDISVFHIRRYLTQEKSRGLSDRTLEGIREVLSAYFGWLQKEGLLPNNPVVNLSPIKYQKQNI